MDIISQFLDSLRAAPRQRANRAVRLARRRGRLAGERLELRMLLTAVVNNLDSGTGSLRWAITEAQAPLGDHTITDGITSGSQTIILLSPLPAITSQLTILGGYIEVDGNGLSTAGLYLAPGSDGSDIQDLVINRFNGPGITVASNEDTIQGCDIGTDKDGDVALPNTNDGIYVTGQSNLISANVLSGNTGHGVAIQGTGADGNSISENDIGVGALGDNPLGNAGDGVLIYGGSGGNKIDGNVIADNTDFGIQLEGSSSNSIENNKIGVGADGETPLGNAMTGLVIDGGSNLNLVDSNVISANLSYGITVQGGSAGNSIGANKIGVGEDGETPLGNDATGIAIFEAATSTVVDSNVISDNDGYGISVSDSGTDDTVIESNAIGTDATGTKALGNVRTAISVFGGAEDTTIGSLTGLGNLISGNLSDGIDLTGQGTNGNYVAGNRIGTDSSGGTRLGNLGDGIAISDGSSQNTLADNVVSGNGFAGVDIFGQGTSGNLLTGNLVGVTAGGATPLGNIDVGVAVQDDATNNTIGGTTGGSGNVISGNGGGGIDLADEGTNQNIVAGNYIGVDESGENPIGNDGAGVSIFGGSSDDSVDGNVISANNGYGIDVVGSEGISIASNKIGVDVGGEKPLGNAETGVAIYGGSTSTTVGSNVISSNRGYGVTVSNSGTNDTVIDSNLIGTDASGTQALGNVLTAVAVFGGAADTTIGSLDGQGNLISGGLSDGIDLDNSGTDDNYVAGNKIGTDISGDSPLGNLGVGVAIGAGSSQNTLVDNIVSGNGADGVDIIGQGTSGNLLTGNFVGVTAAGTAPLRNAGDGVAIYDGATDNSIGGTGFAAGNIISGNAADGVMISGVGTSFNTLDGNLIGTDSSGAIALGNQNDGVDILLGASDNTIGAPTPGDENVISGNDVAGVSISDAGTSGNLIGLNLIGTDLDGEAAVGNLQGGVTIYGGATDNSIGTQSDGGNFISGNGFDGSVGAFAGVAISGTGTSGNVVQNDVIGLDGKGEAALGNAGSGVALFGGATNNVIGALGPDAGLLISGNGGDGVLIRDPGTSDNLVEGSRIGTDTNGLRDLGNQWNGVEIADGATDNLIGPPIPDAENLISGNYLNGVAISGVGTSGNGVIRNFIGTDFDGLLPLGNYLDGVAIFDGATQNLIGSTDAASGNFISGNGFDGTHGQTGTFAGLLIDGVGTSFNLVQHNIIGLASGGTLTIANAADGIMISGGASGNVIGGTVTNTLNLISGNLANGVDITGAGTAGNLVEGNYIGPDISGIDALGNGLDGVRVLDGSTDNTIGGTTEGAGNVISGNAYDGVDLAGEGTSGNLVAGNELGVTPDGGAALGNTYQGVSIYDGATGNTIGGTTAGACNTIAGNGTASTSDYSYANIAIFDSGTSDNLVEGNDIGSNVDNSSGLNAPDTFGAFIGYGATYNTIGGTTPGSGNVISGNTSDGVVLDMAGTSYNLVAGNDIGVDSNGGNALPNSLDGILVLDGASNNTIGGTVAGAGNSIAFNGGTGVTVGRSTTDDSTGNAILENAIYSNAGLGINLGGESSPTGTPVGSPPSGPNNLQNAPVLISALNSASNTAISGTLAAAPNATFRIEFFSNPIGTNQGETFLGFLDLTTNDAGFASFSFSPKSLVAPGLNVTATATDPNGNTSEFSTPEAVITVVSPLTITSLAAVSPNPRNTAVSAINVTFSEPINTTSLVPGALTLIDNGGSILINSGVSLSLVSGTTATYAIGGLTGLTEAEGNYTLTVNGADIQDQNGIYGTGSLSTSWLMDTTPPASRVMNSLGTSQTSDTFLVPVTFSDPAGAGGATPSGVSSLSLYVSVNNGPFTLYQTATFAPTASGSYEFTFTGQDRNLYAFHSVAQDAAGNVEAKAANAIEASTSVPDLNPPVTHVQNTSSYSNGVFTINWAGTDPDQNSGTPAGSIVTVDIYVEIDGGTPTLIAQPPGGTPNGSDAYSGSVTYNALADGQPHTYSFYSIGIDDQQNTQPTPASPDVTFSNITYTASLTAQPITVEKGITGRSFIQYLDVDFNQTVSTSTTLQALVSGLTGANPSSFVELLWYGENLTTSSVPQGSVNLFGNGTTASVALNGNDLSINFGPNGITSLLTENGVSGTGSPTKNFGDGWYALGIDPTGNPSNGQVFWQTFYRLFGDANGTGVVTGPYTTPGTDAYNVYHAEGQSGPLLSTDVDGNGVVNSKDFSETVLANNDAVGSVAPMNFPQFQLFAGAAAAQTNAVAVTRAEVQTLLPLAIEAWAAAGLDAADLQKLEAVKVQVANLGTSILGLEAANTILINQTAAGQSWYLGAGTGAFGLTGPGGERVAGPGSPAAGGVDFLTVLEHELGHVLDLPDNNTAGDLMDITLGAGVRRTPSASDLAALAQSQGPSTTVPVTVLASNGSTSMLQTGLATPNDRRSANGPGQPFSLSGGSAAQAIVDAALASMLGSAGESGDEMVPLIQGILLTLPVTQAQTIGVTTTGKNRIPQAPVSSALRLVPSLSIRNKPRPTQSAPSGPASSAEVGGA
jgi:parallel beta-helix repeat protein